jgi:hypothetical protein
VTQIVEGVCSTSAKPPNKRLRNGCIDPCCPFKIPCSSEKLP